MYLPKYEVGDILSESLFDATMQPICKHILIVAVIEKIECYKYLCLETGQYRKEVFKFIDTYAGIKKVA